MTTTQTMNETNGLSTIDLSGISSAVQTQWATRPADQRFETLDALAASVHSRRARTCDTVRELPTLDLVSSPRQPLGINLLGATTEPTYHAFGQLASLVKAPAPYLRTLPTDLVLANLRHGLKTRGKSDDALRFMIIDPAEDAPDDAPTELAAITSTTYGRIWDADVVAATQEIVAATGGTFYNPKEWGGKPGGLYASREDVFMFLIDGGSIVDGGGERDQLHRGFFVWNSEVGKSSMGLAAFCFRWVCGNYGIHGIEQAKLVRIRHTSGGPDRFVAEAIPALREYVNSSAKPLEQAIRKAKTVMLPPADEQLEHFRKFGITRGELAKAKMLAETEEGQFGTAWDAFNGLTAAAQMLAHVDARVDLSRRAGKYLETVAA